MANQLLKVMLLGHALFNSAIFIVFVYQAYLGLSMRRSKLAGQIDFVKKRRHRRNGPIAATLAIFGFVFGLIIVTIDHGNPFTFPVHLFLGSTLIVLIVATYVISRKMIGDPGLRDVHRRIGIVIITTFVLQIFVGIGMLTSHL